jgi:pSer/pThr/pTyr-binding forkhead associated (FHA) protein
MSEYYFLKNLGSNEDIVLNKPHFVIGRGAECDIRVKMTDLSRQHAKLTVSKNSLTVEDMGSTNGTLVNNKKVSVPTKLNHGDIISIGRASFSVNSPSSSGDSTIIAEHLSKPASSFVMDEAGDNNTVIRTPFPKPPGWPVSEEGPFVDENSKQASATLDKLIEENKITTKIAKAVFIIVSDEQKFSVLLVKPKLNGVRWVIGRESSCDLVINDPTVSNVHAYLVWENNRWLLRDNNSTNGIKVNKVKTVENAVISGDHVTIGKIDMLFRVI